MPDLICYLRYKTVAELGKRVIPVPKIMCEYLGNPATYSVKAIDLHLRERQREAAEREAATSRNAAISSPVRTEQRQGAEEGKSCRLRKGETVREFVGNATDAPSDKAVINHEAERAPSLYAFQFEVKKQRWHLRYPGDEDDDFKNLVGLQMCAKLLKDRL